MTTAHGLAEALFLVHAAVLASLLLSLSGAAGFLLIWNPRALPTGLKWLPPAAQDTFQAASGWVPAPLAASMSLLLFLAAASLTGAGQSSRTFPYVCQHCRPFYDVNLLGKPPISSRSWSSFSSFH